MHNDNMVPRDTRGAINRSPIMKRGGSWHRKIPVGTWNVTTVKQKVDTALPVYGYEIQWQIVKKMIVKSNNSLIKFTDVDGIHTLHNVLEVSLPNLSIIFPITRRDATLIVPFQNKTFNIGFIVGSSVSKLYTFFLYKFYEDIYS